MWVYQKKLQYPVKITRPNPALAKVIISQLGGPDGETGAALRYLSQRFSAPTPEMKGILTDVGTEGSKRHNQIIHPPRQNRKLRGTASQDRRSAVRRR